MRYVRALVLTGLLTLPALVAGCQASQPIAPTPTAEPSPTLAPTPLPPTATPAEEADAVPAEEEFAELTRFVDPNNLFTIEYPANFEVRQSGGILGEYSYTFLTPGKRGALIVSLAVNEDGPPSDEEWRQTTRQPNLISALLQPVALDTMTELSREVGTTERFVRIEMGPGIDGMKGTMWLAEQRGTVALLVWAVPEDMWESSQPALDSAIDSFSWSPELTQMVLPGLE